MKFFCLKLIFFLFLSSLTIQSQTIVNTESMMHDLSKTFVYHTALSGNLNFGNINLLQLNSVHQISVKHKNHFIRLIGNYNYLEENKKPISSDFTGQLRYNYQIKENSLFAFVQGQNIKSLLLSHRYLYGGGYRIKILKKKKDYWDFSLGTF